MTTRRRVWPVLVTSAVALIILLSLGVWQVNRLAWKEALIARLDANAAGDPVTLGAVQERLAAGETVEFVKVRFDATYLPDKVMKLIGSVDGGPGWTIVSPAVTPDGLAVMVDRGLVPDNRLGDVQTPAGALQLTGVVRLHDAGKGYFDPANDPAGGTWYWWDVPAMYASAGFADGARPLPFVVQLLPEPGASAYPRPPEPKAHLRNNHLGYAITWFGLAAVLVVMTGFYVRALMNKSTA